MGKGYNRLKINLFFIFLLIVAILLHTLSPSPEARKPLRWRAKRVVVVDPGHGGRELGARGSAGILEKEVTLELSRRIESELKSRFKVQLTRTDDYRLDIIRRSDVANHLEADAFVSIHAGGSFQHDARGMRIFYFRENRSASPSAASSERNSWDRLQLKHAKNSRILAESLQNRFERAMPGIRCQVDAAPLLVLRGADMPAVLIEVGTLTNPEDEKRLSANDNLTVLGRAIAVGINDFFRNLDGKSDQ